MSYPTLNTFGVQNGGLRWSSFADQGVPQFGAVDDEGFGCAVRLDGNVGYVEIRSFRGAARARAGVAAVLASLAGARALIIDLRRNRGGDRSMAALLTSMLFDTESVYRDAVYARAAEAPWSLALAEPRWATQRVYVLVSQNTDSLGQAFAANLQRLGRGFAVGESGPQVSADIEAPAAAALVAAYQDAIRTAD